MLEESGIIEDRLVSSVLNGSGGGSLVTWDAATFGGGVGGRGDEGVFTVFLLLKTCRWEVNCLALRAMREVASLSSCFSLDL